MQLCLLLYLCVRQSELSRHVRQVTLLWVTLHPHVPVILHFWGVRPVLVALGLKSVWHHGQITLLFTWVISQDTIYYFCYISCALLSWNQTRIPQHGAFHLAVWRTRAIHQEQDVNWLSFYVCACLRVCARSSSRQKLRALDEYQENDQLMRASGYQATGKLRQQHLHSTRPWYLAASVSVRWLHPYHWHSNHSLHLATLCTAKPCNYSQLCQLIIFVCKHHHQTLNL